MIKLLPGPGRTGGPVPLASVPRTREQAQRPAPGGAEGRSAWRERAACLGAATDLFFPVGAAGAAGGAADETRRARQICASCPVRQQCLAYALASGQQYGIWGGSDEQERRRLRRKLRTADLRRG
jgi:WhiB family transcriptional regulator, redox-sensing transcriptional regulator